MYANILTKMSLMDGSTFSIFLKAYIPYVGGGVNCHVRFSDDVKMTINIIKNIMFISAARYHHFSV